MSILQKIIQDMYIEPELLAELDDEQKQILFCKMREEQIRRWNEFDQQKSEQSQQNANSQSKEAKVRWLLGTDGHPWVWVMGEHHQDKTIEQILEEETQEKARKLAEQEAEQLRTREEEELKEKLRQEQFEAEQERKLRFQQELKNRFQSDERFARFNSGSAGTSITEDTNESNFAANSDADVILRQKQKAADNNYFTSNNELERKMREETDRRIEEEKTRRTSEIYQTLVEARERANLEAEKEAEDERRYWEEQERKSREAEDQIRLIARKAREQHKMHGLRTSSSLLSLIENESYSSKSAVRENGKQRNIVKLSRPLKPKSRVAIIEWFLKEELPDGAGLVPGTSKVCPWFHGLISRDSAEQLLVPNSAGAYLIRVSERIWGYVLSYKSDGGGGGGDDSSPFKHFLIERLPNGYQFLGTNQIVHENLWDLVTYHQTTPITLKGKEVLNESVGQIRFPPDYQELLGFGSRSAGAGTL